MNRRAVGESNQLFDLFTSRLGRVTALAVSVRELKSKLRYTLQYLGPVRLGLVAGRMGWRLIHAEPDEFFLNASGLVRERHVKFVALLNLLGRLVVAEGRRPRVYRELEQALVFLTKQQLSPEDVLNYELVATLRLLGVLGYWPGAKQLDSFVPPTAWSKLALAKFTPHRQLTEKLIEQALYHSHL